MQKDVDRSQQYTIAFVTSSFAKKISNAFNGMVLIKFPSFSLNDSWYHERYDSLQDIGQVWDCKNISVGCKNNLYSYIYKCIQKSH